MSLEDDDDYLSDKFLAQPTVTQPTTYAQRRKEAARLSSMKHEQNRKKSRRLLEQESRVEGLSKSLFETQDASSSKALSMMMKMGFKPGQSLGKSMADNGEQSGQSIIVSSQHKTEPVPINEWEGKKGIGSLKRALSPETTERLAKMAKMAEASSHQDFRDRAKQEYEERRAEGRLGPAQLTCRTLDEKEEKEFSVLWLNPANPETFPTDLLDALSLHSIDWGSSLSKETESSLNDRLRRQMEQDKLRPLDEDEEELISPPDKKPVEEPSPELIEEAVQFLRLRAQDRLQLMLSYLRNHHAYCFWCGVHYKDTQDMDGQCPGQTEEDHD